MGTRLGGRLSGQSSCSSETEIELGRASFREVEGEGEKCKRDIVVSRSYGLLFLFHSGRHGGQRAVFLPRAVAVQIWTKTTEDWQVRTYSTGRRRRDRRVRGGIGG